MKTAISVLSLVLGCAISASASVTLEFSQAYTGGIASNFSSATTGGTGTNGMQWGIVVETAVGGSFANNGTHYNAYAAGVNTAGYLSANGVTTNDYYIPEGTTYDSSSVLQGDFATPGGPGTIGYTAPINLTTDIGGGIAAGGDKFALIWFSTSSSAAGANYGFLTNPSFTIPNSDGTYPEDSTFTGAQPVENASNTFSAAISGSPEPSRLLLLGVGGLAGMMVRRRRAQA